MCNEIREDQRIEGRGPSLKHTGRGEGRVKEADGGEKIPASAVMASKMIKPEKPPVMFSLYWDVGADLGTAPDWWTEGS